MLLPRRVDDLLVAGRCASMTHLGQSAERVSGGCFVMGQAASTASALAVRAGVRPRDLDVAAHAAAAACRRRYLGQNG